MYTYKAQIERVVDGDTFIAVIDLGFDTFQRHTFRLYGVDTPETYRPKSENERVLGEKATEFVRDLIEHRSVTVITHNDKQGKYGRYLAEVHTSKGYLSELLKENKLTKSDVTNA